METDILIAGSGCAGLYCALKLPQEKRILIVTKRSAEESDSFLAQGGICVLRDKEDYPAFLEDTMRAGHYENDRKSVDVMIKNSRAVIDELIALGVDFARDEAGELLYTREGAHSAPRILFHKDITGKEITRKLLAAALARDNITLLTDTTLLDIVEKKGRCVGGVLRMQDGSIRTVSAAYTVLATGGVGGLYPHSTNYPHLTGDALAIALRHNVPLRDAHYVQIHPTTLYSEDKKERSFLISESVRGEGAELYDKNGKRFVYELLPRDKLTAAIYEQMEIDGTRFVWEELRTIPEKELFAHFPNIIAHCAEQGWDVTKSAIPVVPAQHYFMGGIRVDLYSATAMEALYAIGETACNGVHGKNRLASNSLLESLVFAGRAAEQMTEKGFTAESMPPVDMSPYRDIAAWEAENRALVIPKLKKEK